MAGPPSKALAAEGEKGRVIIAHLLSLGRKRSFLLLLTKVSPRHPLTVKFHFVTSRCHTSDCEHPFTLPC
jgi:hypothetical protein